jgi:hypothetical protein
VKDLQRRQEEQEDHDNAVASTALQTIGQNHCFAARPTELSPNFGDGLKDQAAWA